MSQEKQEGTTTTFPVRKFETGATRDTEVGKLDYEGFLSPLVLECYAKFMNKHRKQSDGTLRDSDNWQKGIPLSAYMKSMFRHFMTVWKFHRTGVCDDPDGIYFAFGALMFNVMGYLHELLKPEAIKFVSYPDPIGKAEGKHYGP